MEKWKGGGKDDLRYRGTEVVRKMGKKEEGRNEKKKGSNEGKE